jgi:hypothetical protein
MRADFRRDVSNGALSGYHPPRQREAWHERRAFRSIDKAALHDTHKEFMMTLLKMVAWTCCAAALASPFAATAATKKLTQEQAEAQAKANYEIAKAMQDAEPKYPKFSELLAQGFEIKGVVPLSNYGTAYAYVLLQKGGQAYQCTNSGTTYVNAYTCVPVIDAQKPAL